MKFATLTLFTAFIVITFINITEVWVLAFLTYSILLLVLRRDLDKDHQHNHIKGLKARIEQLKIDNDCLELAYDTLLKKANEAEKEAQTIHSN